MGGRDFCLTIVGNYDIVYKIENKKIVRKIEENHRVIQFLHIYFIVSSYLHFGVFYMELFWKNEDGIAVSVGDVIMVLWIFQYKISWDYHRQHFSELCMLQDVESI